VLVQSCRCPGAGRQASHHSLMRLYSTATSELSACPTSCAWCKNDWRDAVGVHVSLAVTKTFCALHLSWLLLLLA
jgi:hypothetical protein